MNKLKCWLFGHRWGKWVSDFNACYEIRVCKRCFKTEKKKVI